ncbi:hypothetical protein Agub_g262 [Astrephomene gubernaculifera]|uniref:Uncharacterized protein n=1 Tax=Astrephomene gubernaculifera TaxID=47775 RepID=A0AAD3DG63_9CHLO|nr:hypothetical protein Agub_g262 [Astrephomene gubernaculifera]
MPEGSTALIKSLSGGLLRWQDLEDGPELPTEGRLEVVFKLGTTTGSSSSKDYSGAWLYSKYVAEKFGMDAPYKQYGLYSCTAAGMLYGASKWRRASLLAQAVLQPDPSQQELLRLMLGATADQFKLAVHYVGRFKAQGVIGAASAPLLWLGYCRASRLYKQRT